MATKANFVIEQGTDLSLSVYITDEVDISNYTCRSKMKKHYLSANSVEITCSIVNSSSLSLTMTNANTSNVDSGRWVYDVELVSSIGLVTRVVEGIVTVTPEIT